MGDLESSNCSLASMQLWWPQRLLVLMAKFFPTLINGIDQSFARSAWVQAASELNRRFHGELASDFGSQASRLINFRPNQLSRVAPKPTDEHWWLILGQMLLDNQARWSWSLQASCLSIIGHPSGRHVSISLAPEFIEKDSKGAEETKRKKEAEKICLSSAYNRESIKRIRLGSSKSPPS